MFVQGSSPWRTLSIDRVYSPIHESAHLIQSISSVPFSVASLSSSEAIPVRELTTVPNTSNANAWMVLRSVIRFFLVAHCPLGLFAACNVPERLGTGWPEPI